MSLDTSKNWDDLTETERREYCLFLLGRGYEAPNPLEELTALELFERNAEWYGLVYWHEAEADCPVCDYTIPFHSKANGETMFVVQTAAELSGRRSICRACYEAKKARDEWDKARIEVKTC